MLKKGKEAKKRSRAGRQKLLLTTKRAFEEKLEGKTFSSDFGGDNSEGEISAFWK